jgi:Kef-type K+ transport system membrane component KefB
VAEVGATAGAIGEFGPIILMALLLQTGSLAKTGGLIALFAVLSVAAAWVASKAQVPSLIELCRRMMHTSAQLPLRTAVLILAILVLVSRGLGLDTVLGAVTAGIVVSLAVRGNQREALAHKVDGLGFGFFIPIFFVVSGIRFDLTALLATPSTILRVPLFLVLFLVVRGLPALLLYRKDLPFSERLALALLCATELPLVVAITTIGVATGKMHPENAAALVGAGMLSVLLFPLIAFWLRGRTAAKEATVRVVGTPT